MVPTAAMSVVRKEQLEQVQYECFGPNIGTTHYNAQLGSAHKGRVIKELFCLYDIAEGEAQNRLLVNFETFFAYVIRTLVCKIGSHPLSASAREFLY